jgi:hypothetical protein
MRLLNPASATDFDVIDSLVLVRGGPGVATTDEDPATISARRPHRFG